VTMHKPYVKTCQKCGKTFATNNPLVKLHKNCKAKRQKRGKCFNQKRIEVLIRDNQVCQHCGFDFKEGGKADQINVYHIDKNPLNNDINNLVTLCAKCRQLAQYQDLEFKFKQNFRPKKYKETYVKPDKFLFKNIG